MNNAAAKIQMLKGSMRCFAFGLLGLLPVIGLPFAFAALWMSGSARVKEKQFWNAARPYRIIGTACAAIGPVFWFLIMAAMLLPALANAKHKAQVVNSMNNMKQIGLALRIWEADHNGQYPWNVSQTKGGVKEVCGTDADGFEKNPVAVFKVMSNELFTPKILVCADDPSRRPAPDFASLTANNISYQLRTGTNVNETHPDEILAVDPINGYVLNCDGSVQKDFRYDK